MGIGLVDRVHGARASAVDAARSIDCFHLLKLEHGRDLLEFRPQTNFSSPTNNESRKHFQSLLSGEILNPPSAANRNKQTNATKKAPPSPSISNVPGLDGRRTIK